MDEAIRLLLDALFSRAVFLAGAGDPEATGEMERAWRKGYRLARE